MSDVPRWFGWGRRDAEGLGFSKWPGEIQQGDALIRCDRHTDGFAGWPSRPPWQNIKDLCHVRRGLSMCTLGTSSAETCASGTFSTPPERRKIMAVFEFQMVFPADGASLGGSRLSQRGRIWLRLSRRWSSPGSAAHGEGTDAPHLRVASGRAGDNRVHVRFHRFLAELGHAAPARTARAEDRRHRGGGRLPFPPCRS